MIALLEANSSVGAISPPNRRWNRTQVPFLTPKASLFDPRFDTD